MKSKAWIVIIVLVAAIAGLSWWGGARLKSQAVQSQSSAKTGTGFESQPTGREVFETVDSGSEKSATVVVAQEKQSSQRGGVDTIRTLSEKVFLTDAEKLALKEALLNPELLVGIAAGLKDESLLTENRFKERLKYIDALYEGLKMDDPAVRSAYVALVTEAFSDAPSSAIQSRPELYEQYFGDRVEMALMIGKIDPEMAVAVERNAASRSAASQSYFEKAREIAGVYQVAL